MTRAPRKQRGPVVSSPARTPDEATRDAEDFWSDAARADAQPMPLERTDEPPDPLRQREEE